MYDHLHGIICPLVSPLDHRGGLDKKAFANIIEHVIAGGVSGLFVLGTTGEFSSFDLATKKEIIELCSGLVKKRVKVLVGITATSSYESLVLAHFAAEKECDAVVASPPFYFHLSQDDLLAYYLQLAEAITLPMYLYNIPALTKVVIEPSTALKLSKHKKIIGLKDSSGDMTYFESLISKFSDLNFPLYMGPEELLLQALQLGAAGGVSGGSNIFPNWYVSLDHYHSSLNPSKCETIQNTIGRFSEAIYHLTGAPNDYLKGLKAAMYAKNLCQNQLAAPLQAFNPEHAAVISERLNEFVNVKY